MEIQLPDPDATAQFAAKLAACLQPGSVIYLYGDLGAGKTTLARGLLRGLGYLGKVRSPTYTIVEPYSTESLQVYHYDLYRLADPEELEYLGLREQCDGQAVLLFEWPERGTGMLPRADLVLNLSHQGEGRGLSFSAATTLGEQLKLCLGDKP